MLALTCEVGVANEVFGNVATIQRPIQRAGRAFRDKFESEQQEKKTKKEAKAAEKAAKEESSENDDYVVSGGSKKAKKKGIPTKLKKMIEGENLYDLLQIPHFASAEVARKAYRKLALIYHPDKTKSASRPVSRTPEPMPNSSDTDSSRPQSAKSSPPPNEVMDDDALHRKFLQINEAYEFLSDESNKRMYDSALPFDESIPEPDDIEDFFEDFSEAFSRWSRWSVVGQVPKLGNTETKYEKVKEFYAFWNNFESWRDFGMDDEYDEEEAECREERRWMERQNAKTRKQAKIKETRIIQDLVERSYRMDPRVAKQLEVQKEEKNQKKKERYEKKMEDRKHEEEKARRVGEMMMRNRQAAPDIGQKKEEVDREKTELLSFLNQANADERLRVQECFAAADVQTKKSLMISLRQGDVPKALEIAQSFDERKKAQKIGVWSAEDTMMLARAVQKYPGGSINRWGKIAAQVGRSEEEVQKKVRDMAEGKDVSSATIANNLTESAVRQAASAASVSTTASSDADWSKTQQSQLEDALRKYKIADYPVKKRWSLIAGDVEGKDAKECLARFNYIREMVKTKKPK